MVTSTPLQRRSLIAAEIGLLGLALGTAAGFTRLFTGWSFLTRLAVPVTLAWALASVLRRRRVSLGTAFVVHLAVGAVALTLLFASGTQFVVLPTLTTLDSLRSDITSSFTQFSALIAPVEPTTGFLVVIAAVLWLFAFFADTAAFRFRGAVQAAVPYASAFIATGILARDSGRTTAAVCFIAGLGLFAVTQRALAGAEDRWVANRAGAGVRSLVMSGTAVVAVALVAGMLVGPRLPGGTDPVVDLRKLGQGSGPRTVVSPFVGIRSLLGDRSDQVMFTVDADAPAYWRLTSLEEFDTERDIWVSRGSYRPTDGTLPDALQPGVPTTELLQEIDVSGFAGPWMPGAYVPREIQTDTPISFDVQSASLILGENENPTPISYTLRSAIPDFLGAAESEATGNGALDPSYLERPGLDPEVEQALTEVVAGSDNAFQQMIALQNWFRSEFVYDEGVDHSAASDSLTAFMAERRGFCQQFSSAFALLARSLGYPSRVAVGFTPGDVVAGSDAGDAGSDDTEYVVRGRHAHAWPEVYFDDVGWVPFEPTPQRGNPQSEQYTGVPAQQAVPPPAQAATTTSTSVTTTTTPQTPTSVSPDVDATQMPEEPEEESSSSRSVLWWLAALVVLVGLFVGGLAVRRRRRGDARGDDAEVRGARVADAWQSALHSLQLIDLRPQRHETPSEFAWRVDAELGTDLMGDLATAETIRRFGAEDPSTDLVARSEAAAASIGTHVIETTTRRQRVTARLTPG